mgnify:CR=1 FL=1
MPLPIKPVHSLDLHAEIFDGPSMEGLGLSDIQIQLLGVSSAPKREAAKLSNRDIESAKLIKSVDNKYLVQLELKRGDYRNSRSMVLNIDKDRIREMKLKMIFN